MYEYLRIKTSRGSYTPTQFFELLNNYAKDGWELFYYNEVESGDSYSFTIVLKRKLIENEQNNTLATS